LKKLPYDTLELSKLKKYIDDQAELLGVKTERTVLSHFLTAKLEMGSCIECQQLGFTGHLTSLLNPSSIVLTLVPFLSKIKDDILKQRVVSFQQAKCKKARNACAAELLQYALKICTDNPLLDFNREQALIIPFFFQSPDFELQIDRNRVNFITAQDLSFDSQEIKTFFLNFVTNLKILPSIEINEDNFLLFASQVLLNPQPCQKEHTFSL
jgi:hypothetical protein